MRETLALLFIAFMIFCAIAAVISLWAAIVPPFTWF